VAKTSAAHLVPVEPLPEETVEASRAAPMPLPTIALAPPPKPTWPTLAALAIACGVAAVLLGAWVVLAEARSADDSASASSVDWSLGVLVDSSAERYPLRNAVGRISLVVAGDGRAVLALDGLGLAPKGLTYHAWVVPPGSATPLPSGTFDGSERVVPLARRIAPKALVGVTLEPTPEADRPSRPLRLTAARD
jgi:hypothetical protein